MIDFWSIAMMISGAGERYPMAEVPSTRSGTEIQGILFDLAQGKYVDKNCRLKQQIKTGDYPTVWRFL